MVQVKNTSHPTRDAYGEEILAVGGCGHGADYVISLIPGHSNNLFETKVIDIICKPRIS